MFFFLKLDKLALNIGKEELMFESGPFSYFCINKKRDFRWLIVNSVSGFNHYLVQNKLCCYFKDTSSTSTVTEAWGNLGKVSDRVDQRMVTDARKVGSLSDQSDQSVLILKQLDARSNAPRFQPRQF